MSPRFRQQYHAGWEGAISADAAATLSCRTETLFVLRHRNVIGWSAVQPFHEFEPRRTHGHYFMLANKLFYPQDNLLHRTLRVRAGNCGMLRRRGFNPVGALICDLVA